MHQVLSYETAVRANSSSREYVTKRTCASLLLTIGFFMLISGYLLGNFVTERKYHIRQLLTKKSIKAGEATGEDGERYVQLNGVDYGNLQELRAYQKHKDQLLAAAQVLNKLLQQDESERYLATSLNTEIFNKYVSCTQDIPPNTNIKASQFIEQLIDNTIARQRDCMRIIQVVIDNHLANSQL
ncbi:uncharacterized protein LOC6574802 [Drosophila mojavensis]|uniref:Uncharacterized protein, isoform A n=1 Tax=Drosophila mojavensis TaxID=7230 RepID=B4K6J1_DROMO|nr:uncharacterized protein LOC6574802 [Drosophila mojavensis]EDW16291.1 uncharacterized protein Dmoj_GI22309, isoform A [Drosophila mojavensis]KRG02037.1 uncharacterized protein Dmoj_GI22309, isoform B [Drosophila mojavensis]